MMETVVIILLLVVIGLVATLIFKGRKDDVGSKIQSIINEKFFMFQESISKTMENTRQEMQNTRREVVMSKDMMSEHAIETLKTIKGMGATIEEITRQQKDAQDLGNSLKYLLQTPKLRGSYGEEILEDMLDKVLPGMWERQFSIEDGERVDAVIKYKDVIIPIDAKFPREIYERYLNAEGEEEKRKNWKLYEEGMKVQISSIRNKYIKPHKGTSDFALMFIPSESIYYETIAEKNHFGQPCNLYEFARNNKVIAVSPNTLYAFLQVVMMGIRNLDIIKSAKKLQEALLKIEKNFGNFYAKYEDIGQALDKAQGAFRVGETHIKRFKSSVDATLKLELKEGEKE